MDATTVMAYRGIAYDLVSKMACVLPNFSSLKFWSPTDVIMMNQALTLARHGAERGEIPVGAVVVHDGQILGEGFNCPIGTHDPTHHAEIVALRQACRWVQNYRLPIGSTLYVTLEPCTMCFGSLIHARVSRVVFGAYEPKAGAVASQLNLAKEPFYNHTIAIQGGLLANESSMMLSQFFKQRRADKKKARIESQINEGCKV
ncbi:MULTISPECIES: tRNA adenosine(34) deaminase TadA [unclassified Moraxella]|uniref:tRNA adenosine(34) deaminase TadA n=1 Tax=unclassified Moraxella TaxID=2685852 RepID=UPI00359DA8D9